MIGKYLFKKQVKNCYICAIKPLIYAGFTITYIGKAKCPHANDAHKPRIEENVISTALARFFNLFLLTDVVYVIFKLCTSQPLLVSPKYYYNVFLPNYINTLNYTFCFLWDNSRHIRYTNGLITLIHKRKFFGIDSILTKKITVLLQLWSSLSFCCIFIVCVLFLATTTPRELSLESFLLATSMLINNINAISFTLDIITSLMIYKVTFKACFDSIYRILKQPVQRRVLVNISFQRQLQFQQQFYIAACSNYKRHVFGCGTVVFYAGQFVFTVISVIQAYFFIFETTDSEGFWFTFFSKIFYTFLVVSTYVVCTQIQSVECLVSF